MTLYQFKSHTQGRMHHLAVFTMNDGTTVKGNMQPDDGDYVYLTLDDGLSGGKLRITDIQSVDFPND
jgi:hypothetical protein